MTILLLASRGKTSTALIPLLQTLSPTTPLLLASRTPSPSNPNPLTASVLFSWHNPSTWPLPFTHALTQTSPITAVYIVGIDEREISEKAVVPFIRFAKGKGVSRFVVLSAWENEGWGGEKDGGLLMSGAHREVVRLGKDEGVEWAVLRPHFFMENLLEPHHIRSMRASSTIYSGAGSGKLPFIAASDIAHVAAHALLSPAAPNREFYLTGRKAWSYDDVAALLSRTLHRPITHVSLSQEDFNTYLEREVGMDPWMAGYMAALDLRISEGKEGGEEQRVSTTVEEVLGRPAVGLEEWIAERGARGAWE